MTATTRALMVTIDGCPYAAGTEGCPSSVTSTDPDYPSGVSIVVGGINADSARRVQWSETIKPTTGELSVDQITLALEDKVVSTGIASGRNVWTYLYSRRVRAIRSATIASPGIGDADMTVTTAIDPGFSTGAQVIWIDREALLCSGYNAGTKTFTVTTRGYLGTRAANHYTDDVSSFAPVVWDEFPNHQRRRAILWLVEGGVATPIWRGYVGRAPRLTSDGARWEVQMDHAWMAQSERSLGPSRTSVRIAGFQPDSFSVRVAQRGIAGATINVFDVLREPISGAWPETLEDVASLLGRRLTALFAPALSSSPVTGTVLVQASDDRLRAETSLDTSHDLVLGPRIAAPFLQVPPLTAPAVEFYALSTEVAAGRHSAVASSQYPIRTHVALIQGANNAIPVDSVTNIPTSGLVTATTDGGTITRVQWALQSKDIPAFHIALTGIDATNRIVSGVMRRTDVGYGLSGALVEFRGNVLLTEPLDCELVTRVESSHWLYAIRRGALANAYGIDDQADSRDWSWNTASRVVGSTGGEYTNSRVWMFDGSTTLGAFVKDALALDACALALHGSRLSFDVIDPPLETEAVALAIDLTDGDGIAKSVSGYTTQHDAIVNVVRVKREGGSSVTLNNQTSIALYGLTRPLEIEAKGALVEVVADRTPFELARGALSRVMGMWSEPTELLSVSIPVSYVTTVELCSVVSITSKVLPDGEGSRGVSKTRKGRVVSRQIDFSTGQMRLSIVVYPYNVAGYAPCCRVLSFGGAGNKTVTVATGIVTESSPTLTDYAASNRGDYGGSPQNDGGVQLFSVGDVVRFRVVDDTTSTEEGGFTVLSVNPAGPSLTIDIDPSTGATNWVTTIATKKVEMVFEKYTGIVSTQKRSAYVGGRTTRKLDSDPLREWAP